jgi:hypothetical protein
MKNLVAVILLFSTQLFATSLRDPYTIEETLDTAGTQEAVEVMHQAKRVAVDLSEYKAIPKHVSLPRNAAILLSGEFHDCKKCRGYHSKLHRESRKDSSETVFLYENPPTDDNPLEDQDIYLLDGTLAALRSYSDGVKRPSDIIIANHFAASVFAYGAKEFEEILPQLQAACAATWRRKRSASQLADVVKELGKHFDSQKGGYVKTKSELGEIANKIDSQKEFVEYALSVLAVHLIEKVEKKYPQFSFPATKKLLKSGVRIQGINALTLGAAFNDGLRNVAIAQNLVKFYFDRGRGRDVGMISHFEHVEVVAAKLKAAFEREGLEIPVIILPSNLSGKGHVPAHVWPYKSLPQSLHKLKSLNPDISSADAWIKF